MAAVTRGTGRSASLTTPEPPNNARTGSGIAATALPAIRPCYFGADGSINLSNGSAANAAAVVDGWTLKAYAAGETATLYSDVTVSDGAGSSVTPGTSYYLGTTAGGLDTAATTGGTVVIARGVPDNSLYGVVATKMRVQKSY